MLKTTQLLCTAVRMSEFSSSFALVLNSNLKTAPHECFLCEHSGLNLYRWGKINAHANHCDRYRRCFCDFLKHPIDEEPNRRRQDAGFVFWLLP